MTVSATYPVVTPASSSGLLPTSTSASPPKLYSFIYAMKRVSPPWLRRLVGGAVMEGLGVPAQSLLDRTVEGLRKRFPNAASPQALGFIGRERRIPRGPGETDATYAARLIPWWDAHKTRGGAYALLTQMHAFFEASDNVPITVVANSGTKHVVDAAGVITQGEVSGWIGDGDYPDKWARIFIIFQLAGTTFNGVDIYSLTDAERAIACAVPREWNAAHIDKIYMILLPADGAVYGFPPIHYGDVGATYGGNEAVLFDCI